MPLENYIRNSVADAPSDNSLMSFINTPSANFSGSGFGGASHNQHLNGKHRNVFLNGYAPYVQEPRDEIARDWELAAGRSIDMIGNSGFLRGCVETVIAQTVGAGLRMTFRPDHKALGWDIEKTREWSREVEAKFLDWGRNPRECDAGGKMTFGQMQQAWLQMYLYYGEGLALLPMLNKPFATSKTKVMMLPSSRLSNHTDYEKKLIQGVYVDGHGAPLAYDIQDMSDPLDKEYRKIQARDKSGRANVCHFFEPSVGVTRGLTPFAPVLKVIRQISQYMDATMVKAMLQTIFAATLETDVVGQTAFDGLLTDNDTEGAMAEFAGLKSDWYDGASIDLHEHGRIAHLFMGDKLDFKQANIKADDFDRLYSWLMRECATALGVTYDSFTGDDRDATYSSIRMGGAKEWLKVTRRRENLVVPFCKEVFGAWLEEQIGVGEIKFPGGFKQFQKVRGYATKAKWSGPAKPQADDFKTARAYQVRKDIGGATMEEISEEYGRDWDDDMYQRSEENSLAEKLGLPIPHASLDPVSEAFTLGEDLGGSGDETGPDAKKKSKGRGQKSSGGVRGGSDAEPQSNVELELTEA